ncbi:hypothetical protein P9112_012390 [Eukaryota sp. TZLM1-RC]
MSKFIPLDDKGQPLYEPPSPSLLSDDIDPLTSPSQSESESESATLTTSEFTQYTSPSFTQSVTEPPDFSDFSPSPQPKSPSKPSDTPPSPLARKVLSPMDDPPIDEFPFTQSSRFSSLLGLFAPCTDLVSITSQNSISINSEKEILADRVFSFNQFSPNSVSFTFSNLIKQHFHTPNHCPLAFLCNSFEFLVHNDSTSTTPLLQSVVSFFLDEAPVRLAVIQLTRNRIFDLIGDFTLPSGCMSCQPATKKKIFSSCDYFNFFERLTSKHESFDNSIVVFHLYLDYGEDSVCEDTKFSAIFANYTKDLVKDKFTTKWFSRTIDSLSESLYSNKIPKSVPDLRLINLLKPFILNGIFTSLITTDGTRADVANLTNSNLFSLCKFCRGGGSIPKSEANSLTRKEKEYTVKTPSRHKRSFLTRHLPAESNLYNNSSEVKKLQERVGELTNQNNSLNEELNQLNAHNDDLVEELNNVITELESIRDFYQDKIDEKDSLLLNYQHKFEEQNLKFSRLLEELNKIEQIPSRGINMELITQLRELIALQQEDLVTLCNQSQQESRPRMIGDLTDQVSLIPLILDTAKALISSPQDANPNPNHTEEIIDMDQADTPESIVESVDLNAHENAQIRAELCAYSMSTSVKRIQENLLLLEGQNVEHDVSENVMCIIATILDELHSCCQSGLRAAKLMFSDVFMEE